MYEYKIDGELCSKSNSRRIVNYGGRPRIIKSQKALDYVASSLPQIARQKKHKMLEDYIAIELHVWYKSKRPDLDVSLIQDVLQEAGVYKNDRLIVELHAFKYIDRKNPRIIVRIKELSKDDLSNSGLF